MRDEKTRTKKIFDELLDVFFEEAKNWGKVKIQENLPKVLDWLFVKGSEISTKKYEQLKNNRTMENETSQTYQLDLSVPTKLEIALNKYSRDTKDVEARSSLVKEICKEISDNQSIWSHLDVYVQEIICPCCENSIIQDWHDYVTGESSSEKSMGLETIYQIESDDIHCDLCNTMFKAEGYICTYPDGVYDSHKLESSLV